WKEVTVRCLCAAWRPLWPECVLQRDFEGFEELEEEAVVHEIVSLGNSMGLEVDDDDVEELVEEHSKELSTEELLELHKEQNETLKRSLTSEESGEEEDKEESRIIPAKDLKDAFFCWSKLSKLAEDYHPDVGSVQKAISVFNDNVMNYFWKVQKSSYIIKDATANIALVWKSVPETALNGVWHNLWREVVHDFKGFDEGKDELRGEPGFQEIQEEDVNELLVSMEDPLTSEEVLEMAKKHEEEEEATDSPKQ
ncbi:Tigger transposable element-derived protein 1-like 202, partial [Homarus americanus]